MWQKKESKLELAASMVRQVMPAFTKQKTVIILCDSWYVKKDLVCLVDEYENLDLIGSARVDSVTLFSFDFHKFLSDLNIFLNIQD